MTRVELLIHRLVVAARSLSRRGPAGDLGRFLGGVLWILHTGRSRGGFTTKAHAVVSASGRGLTFALTPGQRGDVTQAIPLLGSVPTPLAVLGDRADDADALLAWWSVHDVAAVIPARRNRRVPCPLDRSMYAMRNVIERFFGRWKRWRRVGTRSDKTAASY
ncbi:MAG: transposase, partial [Myxococcota bacterium]